MSLKQNDIFWESWEETRQERKWKRVADLIPERIEKIINKVSEENEKKMRPVRPDKGGADSLGVVEQ